MSVCQIRSLVSLGYNKQMGVEFVQETDMMTRALHRSISRCSEKRLAGWMELGVGVGGGNARSSKDSGFVFIF